MTPPPPRPSRDPVDMEVFRHRLLSITDDMGHALVRSSFSTNIKERKDCSVGLFDRRGRLSNRPRTSHSIPLHLGSLHGGGGGIAREIRARGDGIVVSADCQGTRTPAPGLFDGGVGGRARLVTRRGGRTRPHAFVAHESLAPGDGIRLETPGGAGMGPPAGARGARHPRRTRVRVLRPAALRPEARIAPPPVRKRSSNRDEGSTAAALSPT